MGTGHGYWPAEWMWIFPIVMPIVMLTALYLLFGRGCFRTPWNDSSGGDSVSRGAETALEILKKRYAKGEITQNEFEQMKKNILS